MLHAAQAGVVPIWYQSGIWLRIVWVDWKVRLNNLTSMVSEQQKVMKEIQEMLAAMHTRSERRTSTHRTERAESSHWHGKGERFFGRFNSG